MSIEEKAKAYDEALERAKMYRDNAKAVKDYSAVARYENIFPELRKEEKPLTPFQQCLNCILRGVYYAEVPCKKVNEFIVNVVRARTDELIKLAKIHEYTDCQLHKGEDEKMMQEFNDWLCEEIECRTSSLCDEKDRRTLNMLCYILSKVKNWLEKQKGQKDYRKLYEDIAKSEWFKKAYEGKSLGDDDEQKEQKPNFSERDCTDFEIEVHEIIAQARNDSRLNDADVLKQFEEEAAFALMLKANKLMEQKPQDRLVLHDTFGYEKGRQVGQREGVEMVLKTPESYGLYKPAEWSEEIIRKAVKEVGLTQHQIDWFKTNVFPPKQEWSKEDEKMLKNILWVLESYISKGESAASPSLIVSYPTYYKEIDWLKSRRPQPDQDPNTMKRNMALSFGHYLDKHRPDGKMCLSNGEWEDLGKAFVDLDWGKIIRYANKYQPHWKPSEEQMKAFRKYIEDFQAKAEAAVGGWDNFDVMIRLYEQLKKLM